MKYDRETLAIKKDKEYQLKKVVEKDCLTRKEKEFRKIEILETCSLKAPQKVFDRSQSFEWDLFQWADYEFVQWANQQPASMVIAIMAELKHSPKMKPSIEMLRHKIDQIPLCPIDVYAKKKKLGERSVSFLKQMKKRYGNSLLRILYVTLDS
jgi:hypothetical protein